MKKIAQKLGVITESSKWALSQTIVQGCDRLSQAYISVSGDKLKKPLISDVADLQAIFERVP
jgi:hypothetical protein